MSASQTHLNIDASSAKHRGNSVDKALCFQNCQGLSTEWVSAHPIHPLKVKLLQEKMGSLPRNSAEHDQGPASVQTHPSHLQLLIQNRRTWACQLGLPESAAKSSFQEITSQSSEVVYKTTISEHRDHLSRRQATECIGNEIPFKSSRLLWKYLQLSRFNF